MKTCEDWNENESKELKELIEIADNPGNHWVFSYIGELFYKVYRKTYEGKRN